MRYPGNNVVMRGLALFFCLSLLHGQTPVFKTDVGLVQLDVEAVGRSGKTIAELTKDDFLIYDEHEPQAIIHFGHDTERLDLLLLLDVSDSMRRSIRRLANGAEHALSKLHSGDRVAVMLFGPIAKIFQPLTSNIALAQRELLDSYERSMGIGTNINGALLAAAEYMKRQSDDGRRAIVILTDNDALHYNSPDEDAVRALYDANTVLHGIIAPIQTKTAPTVPKLPPGYTHANVPWIAERSGGTAKEVGGDIQESFTQTIERIRSRYLIQYRLPLRAVPAFHSIGVELTPETKHRYPEATIRTRAGYYVDH